MLLTCRCAGNKARATHGVSTSRLYVYPAPRQLLANPIGHSSPTRQVTCTHSEKPAAVCRSYIRCAYFCPGESTASKKIPSIIHEADTIAGIAAIPAIASADLRASRPRPTAP